MMLSIIPFDFSLVLNSLKIFTLGFLLLLGFPLLLSLFGITTGIRELYYRTLLNIIEWASFSTNASAEANEHNKVIEKCQTNDDTGPEAPPEAPNRWRRIASNDHLIILRRWSEKIGEKIDLATHEPHHKHCTHPDNEEKENNNIPVDKCCSHGENDHAPVNFSINPVDSITGAVHDEKVDDEGYETVKVIVNDMLEFLSAGIEAIIQDNVTSRFEAAQLNTWNLLSRSKITADTKISSRAYVIWIFGFVLRYTILFPTRLVLFAISGLGLVALTRLVALIPNEWLRMRSYRFVMLFFTRVAARSFTGIIRFHNRENRPKQGIVVANHTSPTDVIILGTDNVYSLVGQKHGGFLGYIQKNLQENLWFERTEAKDRGIVQKRLMEHVQHPDRLPILIFPEGTCINNTSVMQFKKGAFEVTNVVYPIAMRYDNRLGDAFWNSHKQGYLEYFISMMTSWAIVCDVWYLPPLIRKEGESGIEFARRCQRQIGRKGGLIDLDWDGNLKRTRVPEKVKDEQRALFFEYLLKTTPLCGCGRPNPDQIKQIQLEVHPEIFQDCE